MPSFFKFLTIAAGMSQKEIAAHLGLTQPSVSLFIQPENRINAAPFAAHLFDLLQKQNKEAERIARGIQARAETALDRGEPFEGLCLETYATDSEARRAGWPSAAAHQMAVAMAVARLPRAVALKLWTEDEAEARQYKTSKMSKESEATAQKVAIARANARHSN